MIKTPNRLCAGESREKKEEKEKNSLFHRIKHTRNNNGVPYGIRTRVPAVRGQRPRPLDEGDMITLFHTGISFKNQLSISK